jgi:hypothetical protein
MLLAYVDESHSPDWYYMDALVVDGVQAAALASTLDQIMATVSADYGVGADAELHGFEVFQGKGDWAGLPPRVRIGVYNQVFDAVSKQGAKIIIRGLHRPGLASRYRLPRAPYEIVLQHLLERIDEYAAGLDTHALVIADEVDRQAKHRADLSRYRSKGTGGYRRRRLSRVVDTLHFAPSSASRLVQAADMIIYLHRRMATHTESDPRATRANQALWARIEPCVLHRWCWMPFRPEMHEGPALAGPKAGS